VKILSPMVHGVLDLVVVVVFALAPSLIGLEGTPAVLAYVLAVVHLVMSVVTAGLPISLRSLVPLPAHGMIELVVGVALTLIGLLAFDGAASTFYLFIGVIILLVFAISRYERASA